MKVEPRQLEIRRCCRRVQSVEHQQCSHLEILTNTAASALVEEFLEALVPPTPYHGLSVISEVSVVNNSLTHLQWTRVVDRLPVVDPIAAARYFSRSRRMS